MNAVPSIEEFHAKRAIAMASRYLEKKSDIITCTDSEIKRTSEFIRTLRELSRNDQVSEQFIDQLRFLVNKLKERKRRLLGKNSLEENRTAASAPSSSAKSIISAASLSNSYNSHTTREDESSIDKIQNLLFEQKVRSNLSNMNRSVAFITPAVICRRCNRKNYQVKEKLKK